MATVLPTTNPITVTSTATLSGNKSFELSIKFRDRLNNTTESMTGTLMDIGKITIKVDEQEDTDTLTDFLYNTAQFSFTMQSDFTNSSGSKVSFGTYLNKLTFTDLIQIEIKYAISGGSLPSTPDIFLAKKLDVTYDEIKRVFSVKAFNAIKFVNAITAYNPDSDEVLLNFSGVQYKGVTARDLIKNYINTLSTSTTTRIQSSFTKTKSDAEGLNENVTGTFHMFITDVNGTSILSDSTIAGGLNQFTGIQLDQSDPSSNTVRDGARLAVLRMGVVESAIIGSLFGENFYVRRDYQGTDTNFFSELSGSDLESFKIKFFSANMKSISISANNIGNNDAVAVSDLTIDATATKTLTITLGAFVNTQTLTGRVPSIPTIVDVSNPSGRYREATLNNQIGAGLQLGTKALDIYKKVLGAANTVKFEFTVLGTEKLKPYEYAKLNASMSDFLVDGAIGTGNNRVRPSSLEYDLKNNKIRVKAYSI
mgnify:CR=1 FL=1|tara:strand:+ start:2949 stop:4391 length:1443 start_codon:yes stop_codon:yes gene_type:complete